MFDAFDEPLSVTKDETFETLKEAQDKADNIEAKCFENPNCGAYNFLINGETYHPAIERAINEQFLAEMNSDRAEAEDYFLHPDLG